VAAQTPQEAAQAWVRRLLVHSDLEGAWPQTDPDLRLCLAQAWVWANRTKPSFATVDQQALAAALAEPTPDHPLWPAFAAIQLAELRDVLAIDLESYGVSDLSRPVAPDYEFVHFAIGTIEPEATAVALIVLLHRTDEGWLVANIGDTSPPLPAWPPQPQEWKPVIELN
jgi:hypothetical protein